MLHQIQGAPEYRTCQECRASGENTHCGNPAHKHVLSKSFLHYKNTTAAAYRFRHSILTSHAASILLSALPIDGTHRTCTLINSKHSSPPQTILLCRSKNNTNHPTCAQVRVSGYEWRAWVYQDTSPLQPFYSTTAEVTSRIRRQQILLMVLSKFGLRYECWYNHKLCEYLGGANKGVNHTTPQRTTQREVIIVVMFVNKCVLKS